MLVLGPCPSVPPSFMENVQQLLHNLANRQRKNKQQIPTSDYITSLAEVLKAVQTSSKTCFLMTNHHTCKFQT